MTYVGGFIKRTRPMTRCQCAVMAVMNEVWSSTDEIWKWKPVYVENKYGRIRAVGYGTISQILRGLVQQGFAEVRGGKRKQYRQVI